LSPETQKRVEILFPVDEQAEASRLLVEQCGNDLFLHEQDEFYLERFRYAALKLSRGTLQGLRGALELANSDWRDLLMAAGFGHDIKAHEKWLPEGPGHP
jgi:hypothetical protein